MTAGAPTPVRRALLLAVGWLGDVFWQSQAVAPLREALPEAALHVATRPGLEPLFAALPGWQVHTLRHVVADRRREPFAWAGLRAEAAGLRRLGPWDLVVDLTGNRHTAIFTWLLRPRRAVGFGAGAAARLAYDARVAVPADEHLARRPLRVAAAVAGGAAWPGAWPAPPPAAPWAEAAAALGLEAGAPPPVVLVPGAGWPGKRWPAERFAALAGRLAARLGPGAPLVVTGGAGERDLVTRVAAGAPGAVGVAGAPLPALLALWARARLLVGHDSGPTHVAAAAGAPVVALFSPTNPRRSAPLGPRVTVLRGECPDRPEGAAQDCHGRPAWPCPAACWDAVTLDRVEAACAAWLDAPPGAR